MINPTIIQALIAALVAVFGYYHTQSALKKRDINESHRNHKIDVYKQIMTIYSEILLNTSQKKTKLMPQNAEMRMINFTTDLINWGSVDTIKTFSKMRQLSKEHTSDVMIYLDELLFDIRKDLGLSNKKLKKGDLVKLYLSNPEIMDKVFKKKAI